MIIRILSLERPPHRLFALDRLEERLEVSLAEAARAAALDHLEEERRSIRDGLSENLEHVPFVVAVDENAKFSKRLHIFLDRANTLGQHFVIAVRHTEE